MVKFREEQIGGITILDEDGGGLVNASSANMQNISGTTHTTLGSTPGNNSFWVEGTSPSLPKFTDSAGTTITLGQGGGGFVAQVQETVPVTVNGQTVFALSESPGTDGYVMMFRNGIKQEHGVDYTQTGTSVTYSYGSMLTTDVVEFFYIVSSGSGGSGGGGGGGSTSLQTAYEIGNQIITNSAQGDLEISGSESLVVNVSQISFTSPSTTITGDGYVIGNLDVSGKLTVDGLIDPPGLVISEEGTAPYDPSTTGTEGLIWVRDDGYLIFTDQSNTDFVIGGSGVGDADLETTLGFGNVTGGNDIVLTSGDKLTGQAVIARSEPTTSSNSGDGYFGSFTSFAGGGTSGNVRFVTESGNNTAGTATLGSIGNTSGAVELTSTADNGTAGNLSVHSTATSTSGSVSIYSQSSSGGSGTINLYSDASGASGDINIYSTSSGGSTGNIDIYSTASASTGNISLRSVSTSGLSGDISLLTTASGTAGDININTTSTSGSAGTINILSDSSGSGTPINIQTTGTGGPGGIITIESSGVGSGSGGINILSESTDGGGVPTETVIRNFTSAGSASSGDVRIQSDSFGGNSGDVILRAISNGFSSASEILLDAQQSVAGSNTPTVTLQTNNTGATSTSFMTIGASDSSSSGSFTFATSFVSGGTSGGFDFDTGNGSAAAVTGGFSFKTGDANAGAGSGGFDFTTGNGDAGFSGDYTVTTGPGGGTGGSGDITFTTGQGSVTPSGTISATTGNSATAGVNSGPINLTTGNNTNDADSGSVNITTGTANTGDAGNIELTPGTSTSGTDGIVNINGDGYVTGDFGIAGKLTVDGLIDPTGMVFSEQSSAPYDPSITGIEGLVWVRDDGYLIFTDQTGTDNTIDLNGAGGTLQSSYEGGNSITTDASNGSVSVTGTESFTANVDTDIDFVAAQTMTLQGTQNLFLESPQNARLRSSLGNVTVQSDSGTVDIIGSSGGVNLENWNINDNTMNLPTGSNGVILADDELLVQGTQRLHLSSPQDLDIQSTLGPISIAADSGSLTLTSATTGSWIATTDLTLQGTQNLFLESPQNARLRSSLGNVTVQSDSGTVDLVGSSGGVNVENWNINDNTMNLPTGSNGTIIADDELLVQGTQRLHLSSPQDLDIQSSLGPISIAADSGSLTLTSATNGSWVATNDLTLQGTQNLFLESPQNARLRSTLGDVTIQSDSGDLLLNSPATTYINSDGYVTGDFGIAGKLTVDGLIDPTGMVFSEQSVAPYDPSTTGTEGMVWVRDDDQLIFTDQNGEDKVVEMVDGYINDQTTSTSASVGTETLFVLLENSNETAVDFDLPLEVGGLSPNQGSGGYRDAAKLIAEVSVTVNRNDGSSYSVSKWIASWTWNSNTNGYSGSQIDSELLAASAGGLTFTATTDGGTPALARIQVGSSSTADQPKYWIEVKMTLINTDGST